MGTEIGVAIAGGGRACGDLRQKSLNLPWWAMVLVIVSGAQEAQAGGDCSQHYLFHRQD